MRKIIIEDQVFQMFPNFKRGLVIVWNMQNHSSHSQIEEMLENQRALRQDCPLDHDFIMAWDEMHRKFGSNPNKFPPSIKSLIKRAQRGDRIPFINSAVALFNYISLKYLLPCGGDDVDTIKGNLRLGIAQGDEVFIPLGGSESEHPVPGEIIYYDDQTKNVMCRKWNWRNGDFSKILESTRKVVINVDGAERIPESKVIEARDELARLLQEKCSAVVSTDLLSGEKRELEIEI
ncbi:MAG: B3/4 domain-containing protein [bacterium]